MIVEEEGMIDAMIEDGTMITIVDPVPDLCPMTDGKDEEDDHEAEIALRTLGVHRDPARGPDPGDRGTKRRVRRRGTRNREDIRRRDRDPDRMDDDAAAAAVDPEDARNRDRIPAASLWIAKSRRGISRRHRGQRMIIMIARETTRGATAGIETTKMTNTTGARGRMEHDRRGRGQTRFTADRRPNHPRDRGQGESRRDEGNRAAKTGITVVMERGMKRRMIR